MGFLPDIIWTGGDWFLHGSKAENLKKMVLHHISDDPKLIKVSATALGTKRFLEGDGDAGNAVSVPCWSKDHVAKPEADEVLHHLLAQVVVNPVQLLLGEKLLQMITQVSRAGRIFAKRFLHNNSGPAGGGHTGSLKRKKCCQGISFFDFYVIFIQKKILNL